MTVAEVELLTDQRNNAVLRLPNRRFPGILVQGDTFNSYISVLDEILAAHAGGNHLEAIGILRELREEFEDVKRNYEHALKSHGIALPY